MTIKRTNLNKIKDIIQNHPEWNIVDMGCHTGGWPEASAYIDIADYSSHYPEKQFIVSPVEKTPCKDKEFDFAVASHIAEHVNSPDNFIHEVTRIAKQGYIEVPTPLFCNLVKGNYPHHLWWVTFDDLENELVFRPRCNVLPEMITVELWGKAMTYFRPSMVTELYWENDIPYRIEEALPEPEYTVSQKIRMWLIKKLSKGL